MTDTDPRKLFNRFVEALNRHDWAAMEETLHPDATLEYPQSRERFTGRDNIIAQFTNYPGLEPGSAQVQEVISEGQYAVSPMFTVIAVEGSRDHGTGITRASYPDGSTWYAINVFDVQEGLLGRMRTFFAPDFEAPDWRAPYRDPIPRDSPR